jgi:hypothetical protein
VIRAIFRSRLGRYVEAGLEFGVELARFAWEERQRKRLGIVQLEKRVRDLEDRAERMERNDLFPSARRAG